VPVTSMLSSLLKLGIPLELPFSQSRGNIATGRFRRGSAKASSGRGHVSRL
jgi:hypothetical protein